ncbi:transmembrane protein 53 [Drosophila albomicans]|uniref:Transmembrane protein 53 n=1 Tax=Drosophila albomicans TaxID=7291 RepID=A0A6P8WNB1_DROAB|nr:transmembrane protein 53 [Drosophila albomicans]XP_034100833.1 transmembrane protein 53 [Drosophila albomicans]
MSTSPASSSSSTHPYGLTTNDLASMGEYPGSYGGGTAGIVASSTSMTSPGQQLEPTARRLVQREREDALEYFIKFPKPTGDNDFVLVSGNEEHNNVPIVMLLGWAGCQDRYLMKYSKIYEERGLITVRYTAPVDTLFWKRSEMIPIGEKILKLIQDMNFDAHPLIFHIFSNGGAYLYQHINLAVRKHKSPLQVRGVIFDSAPGERRMLGLYRAITAIYGREKRCNCLTALAITLTLSIMWFLEETYVAFKSLFCKSTPVHASPFCELKNETNKYPQLFLYSKGDVVIPYRDVEKFIRLRQDQGIDVSSVCFEDAEHVKIYTKYPNEYVQCVCNFIRSCMTIPTYHQHQVLADNEEQQEQQPGAGNLKYD